MEVRAGYKQSDVGLIPEQWVCKPLSEFIGFISYGFTNPMPTVNDGIYMITATDIDKGRLQLRTARKTSEAAFQKRLTAKSKPRRHDILLTKDGTLGRLALVGTEAICINQSVAVLRPNEKVEPVFLKLLLESTWYQTRMLEDAGGSTIKHIYISIVDKMPIGLPLNKAEQTAVATALSDVDALIAGLERLIAKKRDIKQAAMQQLLTGQTRLPGFYEKWEVKRLADIADIKTGPFGSALHERDYVENGTPIITVEHLGEFGVEHKNLPKISEIDRQRLHTYSLMPGDIVFSRVGSVDRNALIRDSESGWLFSGRLLRVRLDPGKAFAQFFSHQFHSETFKARIRSVAVGQTMASLNTRILSDVPVLLPKVPEQVAIATVLADMDMNISALESRLNKTRALKQGMMQELLTGRTRLV